MAFYGNRGGPRGGGARSGAPRGRGGSHSRSSGSRGRGRGGSRGSRGKPVFDSARLAQKEAEDQEESQSGSESDSELEDESDEDGLSSGSEEPEIRPAVKPYAALMESFAAESGPPLKRRKVESVPNNVTHYENGGVDLDHDLDEAEEEGPETVPEGLLEDVEDDEVLDASDPFESHFANPDSTILSSRLESLQNNRWTIQKSTSNGLKTSISVPESDASVGSLFMPPIFKPSELNLKQKLKDGITKQTTTFDALEQVLSPPLFNYQDLLFCERNPINSASIRRLVCLHAVNHIFKTRDRVLKHNARLGKEDNTEDVELRDQGFTRPKVLIILPTRESCARMVNAIISLCEPDQQEHRKRFDDSFVQKDDNFSEDKAVDFKELFAGNDDDMFRLGLKFTRKTIKFFSQFYNSDIIFASPLGLKLALEGKEGSKGDYDFLSSIEMVIVDQAEALAMQNWEHLEHIFEHLNLQPREAHGCDFSRVRNWYLDNKAKYFRQIVALSAFNTPELNTLLFNQSLNWAGRVKINADYSGAILDLGLRIKQTFSRLESTSFETEPDDRFTYFATAILPSLIRKVKSSAGTVLFIPSYLDFVRVRNYFSTSPTTSSLSFGSISEYTSVTEVARARSHFLTGRHSVLLYTERAHHFKRYQIRGVQRVIMYGLPDNPIFYKEIVGGYLSRSVREGKLEPGEGSVRAVFSKWDILKLERIAGSERIGKMLKEKGDTFNFL